MVIVRLLLPYKPRCPRGLASPLHYANASTLDGTFAFDSNGDTTRDMENHRLPRSKCERGTNLFDPAHNEGRGAGCRMFFCTTSR